MPLTAPVRTAPLLDQLRACSGRIAADSGDDGSGHQSHCFDSPSSKSIPPVQARHPWRDRASGQAREEAVVWRDLAEVTTRRVRLGSPGHTGGPGAHYAGLGSGFRCDAAYQVPRPLADLIGASGQTPRRPVLRRNARCTPKQALATASAGFDFISMTASVGLQDPGVWTVRQTSPWCFRQFPSHDTPAAPNCRRPGASCSATLRRAFSGVMMPSVRVRFASVCMCEHEPGTGRPALDIIGEIAAIHRTKMAFRLEARGTISAGAGTAALAFRKGRRTSERRCLCS